MEISKINLFVSLETTKPIKLIDSRTKIKELITPTKEEIKLIQRKILKKNKSK